MKPIPQTDLNRILKPIFEARQIESNLETRGNVDYGLKHVEEGYEVRSISAFVDDLTDPKSCLVAKVGANWISPAPVCAVLLLWVKPEVRDHSTARILDMFKTLEAFARLNECETISGSSWVYLGCPDIDSLWSCNGFDLQEKVFIKNLNES